VRTATDREQITDEFHVTNVIIKIAEIAAVIKMLTTVQLNPQEAETPASPYMRETEAPPYPQEVEVPSITGQTETVANQTEAIVRVNMQ